MYNWAAYEYICAIKSTICHSLYPLKTFTHHTTAACELHRSLVVLFTTAALYLWPNDDNVLLSNNTHFLFVYYHHQVLQCAPDTLAISVCHRHPTKVQVRNVEHFRFFHWDASQSVSLSVSQSVTRLMLCGARRSRRIHEEFLLAFFAAFLQQLNSSIPHHHYSRVSLYTRN